jgi:pimeloyl-ACP methyl ester carboxylesterase
MTISTTTPVRLNECLTTPAHVAATAVGPIQYAERGHGPAALSVHGTPGGYDQGLVGLEFASTALRLIAPSRPGYLGTPLSTGRTPAQQADALAALLDALGIERIPVIGVSGGGPSTYLLAARHPDRVSCLVEIDSICLTAPKPSWLATRLGSGPTSLRLGQVLFDRYPGATMKALLARTSTLSAPARARQAQRIAGDPDRVALMSALTATNSRQAAQRQAGMRNDYAQFADIGQLPLAGITCPTLIVHGTADKDVTTTNATYAHASIPTSELHWIPDGSHFGFGVNDDAQMHQEYVLNWLLAHRNQ